VLLSRAAEDERLGLTLCYETDAEDGLTDIFVDDVHPDGLAAKEGRLKFGDQTIQVRMQLPFSPCLRCQGRLGGKSNYGLDRLRAEDRFWQAACLLSVLSLGRPFRRREELDGGREEKYRLQRDDQIRATS